MRLRPAENRFMHKPRSAFGLIVFAITLFGLAPSFSAEPVPLPADSPASILNPEITPSLAIPSPTPTATAVPVGAPTPVSTLTPEQERAALITDPKPRDWIFFGANFGYTGVRPTDGLRESDRDGAALHLKALFSKYSQDWVGDLGLGYTYHWAQGDDQFSPLRGAKVKVITRAGMIEFSPRYRLTARSQVGLVVNGFFGEDVGFDESRRSNVKFALAAGPRYNFETEGEKNRKRYGIQMMRDLTVPNRGIWWIMADFQFGIPSIFGGGEASKEETTSIETPVVETPKRASAPPFAEMTPEKAVKIYLGEAVLRFKTASSELRPSSKSILETVSGYLKKSPDAWQKMRVDGHADKRGRVEYNNRLSLARANRVRSELIRLGIPKGKLTAHGYGPSRPIDSEEDLEAYALNRRVELWLDGVTDPEALVRDLNDLK